MGLQEARWFASADLPTGWAVYRGLDHSGDDSCPILWNTATWRFRATGSIRLLPPAKPPLRDKGKGGNEPKFCIWGLWEHIETGARVRLLNTHLIASKHVGGRRLRERFIPQVEGLVEAVKSFTGQQDILLLTMDGNAEPNDPHLEDLWRAGLICGWQRFDPDPGTMPGGRTIDYVCWADDPAVTPARPRVLSDEYHKGNDHSPVVQELTWEAQ